MTRAPDANYLECIQWTGTCRALPELRRGAWAIPLLLLCSLAHAVEPKAVIDQGASVNLQSGGGIFLKATQSTGEGPKLWHVNNIIGFAPSDVFPLVGPRDGVYVVELLVSGMVDGRPAWSEAACTVTVGGNPGPTPPTPPGPTPLPPGRFGLAQFTYDTVVQQVNASSRGAASRLAAAYDATIAQAASYTDRDAYVAFTAANNGNALGSDKAAWQNARTALGTKITALRDGGQLPTVPDIAQAWSEISTGLKAVK